jgi:DNA-binding CsgD family transcriptional regulator
MLQEQPAVTASVQFASLPLTPRERDVMQWLAAGKTDRDIAGVLGCSHRTVQKHLERIYTKLGVETRTAAVMRVLAATLE